MTEQIVSEQDLPRVHPSNAINGKLVTSNSSILQPSTAFLWYSPVSRSQTLEDCLLMKENNSPFYPGYCDKMILKYNVGGAAGVPPGGGTTPASIPEQTAGWGWSAWGEWIDDSCPDVCGRRCRVRRRSCTGPYDLICAGRGRAFELEDCPALEEDNLIDDAVNNDGKTTAFQKRTTTSDFMRLDGNRVRPTRRPRPRARMPRLKRILKY